MSSNPTADRQPAVSPRTNGSGLPSAAELEALASFLRADLPDSENADADLDEFMRRLDSAGDVAIEVEERLDVLLVQLDGIVDRLEASHASTQRSEEDLSKNSGSPPACDAQGTGGTEKQ